MLGENLANVSNANDFTMMIPMTPLPDAPTVRVYDNEFVWGCTREWKSMETQRGARV
jgi:hypothetical protein